MARSMGRILAVVLAGASLALVLGGCSGKRVTFHYPGETLVFPNQGPPPAIYVEYVNDLRGDRQRAGDDGATDARFPADEDWDRPVAQIYHDALMQDLTQTSALAVARSLSEADYVLTVDLLHLGCAAKRSSTGWLASALLGGVAGWALGHNAGGAAAGAVLGVGAVPVPTRLRAVCEVRLRVTDLDGAPVWEDSCLGEVTDGGWESMTSRRDQYWVDRYLTVAVKRCNACLVGQLRQTLMSRESAWGRSR
ncbi:MAG: hypothetical protein R3D98_12525 [Candidatus Krumholzibacteriia bacterium]